MSSSIRPLTLLLKTTAARSSSINNRIGRFSVQTVLSTNRAVDPVDKWRATTTRRWLSRKGAKMGNHIQSLREQAHRPSHEEAKERRKKKKSRHDDDSSIEQQRHAADVDDDDDVLNEKEDDKNALPDVNSVKNKMQNIINRLSDSFRGIRGGEATPQMFDDIPVKAYDDDNPVPLCSIAQVVMNSSNNKLAQIYCYDPAVVPSVLTAIQIELELNPQQDENENGVIQVVLPRISQETRRALVKQIHQMGEITKTKVRNVRRKAMDRCKLGQAGKLEGISKDDAMRISKQIEQVSTEMISSVERAVQDKQDNVMAV